MRREELVKIVLLVSHLSRDIESQRGQTIHEISKRKGRSSILERLRQLGFRDSGSEITGCGSSEISSDQRTDQTTE